MHFLKTLILIVLLVTMVAFTKYETAKVTYYDTKYNGRKTALGERYSDNKLTCATSDAQYLGKNIKFFTADTSVIVRCNDLMKKDTMLRFDLTKRAFKILHHASLRKGVSQLSFNVVSQ